MSKLAGNFGQCWDVEEVPSAPPTTGAYVYRLVANNGVFVDLIAQFSRQSKKMETRPWL